jgi:hypothetical protein
LKEIALVPVEPTPVATIWTIVATTQRIKQSQQVAGVRALNEEEFRFRHRIVYPQMLAAMERRWRERPDGAPAR